MSVMSYQITGVSIVCSSVCSSVDQRKHQSSAPLTFVRGIHRWPINSPHKDPVTRKMFPFDDFIMNSVSLYVGLDPLIRWWMGYQEAIVRGSIECQIYAQYQQRGWSHGFVIYDWSYNSEFAVFFKRKCYSATNNNLMRKKISIQYLTIWYTSWLTCMDVNVKNAKCFGRVVSDVDEITL